MTLTRRGLLLASRCHGLAYRCSVSCSLPASSNDPGQPSTSGRSFCTAEEQEPVLEIRQTLLQGALKHVTARGWSDAALVAAARDLQLSPAVTGILPRGAGELVEFFIEQCNSKSFKQLESEKDDLLTLSPNERIAKALQIRLQLIQPVIDSWPQALAVAAKPSNAPHSLKLLFSLVDDIWAALGDDSTDLTWYSKRAVLAGIYTSTSLYMLTDYSPGFQDTWAALRRRVDEGLALDASVQHLVQRGAGPKGEGARGAAGAGAAAGEAGATSATAPPPSS